MQFIWEIVFPALALWVKGEWQGSSGGCGVLCGPAGPSSSRGSGLPEKEGKGIKMELPQREGQDGLPGVPSHVCACPGLCPAAFVSTRGRCPRSRLELIRQPSQPGGAAAGTTPFPWESHALPGTRGPSSYAGSCVPPTPRQQRQGGLGQREAAAPQASESHGLCSGTGREERLVQACGGGGRRWGRGRL